MSNTYHYNEAIGALTGHRWSDDQANHLAWLVETGRQSSATEETIPDRVAEERADNYAREFSPEPTT